MLMTDRAGLRALHVHTCAYPLYHQNGLEIVKKTKVGVANKYPN